jgi:hypothetical protein
MAQWQQQNSFYQQRHATVKTGLVLDYGGYRVINALISNTLFGCMYYIAIHTQWHSGLLLHQNYVILHTTKISDITAPSIL